MNQSFAYQKQQIILIKSLTNRNKLKDGWPERCLSEPWPAMPEQLISLSKRSCAPTSPSSMLEARTKTNGSVLLYHFSLLFYKHVLLFVKFYPIHRSKCSSHHSSGLPLFTWQDMMKASLFQASDWGRLLSQRVPLIASLSINLILIIVIVEAASVSPLLLPLLAASMWTWI